MKDFFRQNGIWLLLIALLLRSISENKAKRFFLQPFQDRDTVLFAGFSAHTCLFALYINHFGKEKL